MGGADSSIVLSNVSYTYAADSPDSRGRTVFKAFSWSLDSGGVVTILGPNMCGKTTLLSLIAKDLTPQTGTITVPDRREYLPQHYEEVIFPWKSVAWNIALPVLIRCSSCDPLVVLRERLHGLSILDELENEARKFERATQCPGVSFWSMLPTELSGGLQHFIAIARCLVSRADLILLDEPLTGLDPEKLAAVCRSLREFIASTPTTRIIVSTHTGTQELGWTTQYRIPESKPVAALQRVE
jgi:ABC-type nitrate/sulfonate/bicarbonate transport system ATPase subunit